eukprot:PhM_4_TR9773/c1_g1_i1/m.99571/K16302/CNNM; metal transporter CNNM
MKPGTNPTLCIVLLAVASTAPTAVSAASYHIVNGTCVEDAAPSLSTGELILRLAATTVCVALSGMFSGLTLGVLGLDTLSLEVIADSGPEPDRAYAQLILPVRRLGNQLLCTLLIGNVMVNVLISLLTAELTNGLMGFFISTVMIVIFGEIVPQASCSRYALYVGSRSIPLVNFFMVLLYVLAKPIAMILDCVLGTDPGQIYDRKMIRRLIAIHAQEHSTLSGLKQDDFSLMAGAIDFEAKRVRDILTPLEEVFMLERETRLTEDVVTKIWETGHSRIPIYSGVRTNVVGILYVKDLLFLDLEEKMSVDTVLKLSNKNRRMHFTFDDVRLKDILKSFASGHSHLALVQEVRNLSSTSCDPTYVVIGIVTLEDVIEELIHVDIRDEDEEDSSGAHERTSIAQFRLARGKATRLTEGQLRAVANYLRESIEEMQHLDHDAVLELTRHAEVLDIKPGYPLYQHNAPLERFILIINGKVEMRVGKEGVRAELPSWSVLGVAALSQKAGFPSPIAEYGAVASAPSRILVVTPELYAAADRATHDGVAHRRDLSLHRTTASIEMVPIEDDASNNLLSEYSTT